MTSAQGDTRKIGVDVVCHSESSTCSLDVDYLPNEILWKLMDFLSAEDLCHLAVCSKAWRNVTNTDSRWLRLCKLRDWERFGKEVDLRKEEPIRSTETSSCGTSPTFQADLVIAGDCSLDLAPTCDWKEVYMRAWHLDRNWSKGCYQENRVVLANYKYDLEPSCIASDGKTFAEGYGCDRNVRLWDLNTGRFLREFEFSSWVDFMVMKNNTGVAAITGGILVFEVSTGKALKLIQGTASDFDNYDPTGLYLEEGKLIASYKYHSESFHVEGVPVHIWDISGLVNGGDDVTCTETLLCTDSLNVSLGKHVKCFACHGHFVITSFKDLTAFILWDTRPPQHARIYRGHSGRITSGYLDKNTIMTGDSVGEIKVWTTESDVCMKTLTTNTVSYRPNVMAVYEVFFNDKGIVGVFIDASHFTDPVDLCFWSRDDSRKLNEYKLLHHTICKMHGNRLITLDTLIYQVSVWEVSTGKRMSYLKKSEAIVHVDDTKIVLRMGGDSPGFFILQFL